RARARRRRGGGRRPARGLRALRSVHGAGVRDDDRGGEPDRTARARFADDGDARAPLLESRQHLRSLLRAALRRDPLRPLRHLRVDDGEFPTGGVTMRKARFALAALLLALVAAPAARAQVTANYPGSIYNPGTLPFSRPIGGSVTDQLAAEVQAIET